MLKTVFLSILFKKLEIYQILQFKWSYGQMLFIQENFFAYTSEKINIFKQTICQYKKETYLNLKNYDDRVAVTKLRLSSHKLVVVTTAK